MKKVLFLSLMINSISIQAQSFDFLDANNISARINADKPLFSDPYNKKGFEFPVGSGNTTLYFASLTVGAKNAMGTVYEATYSDLQPGPLQNGTATPSTNAAAWNRVWKIGLGEINYHRLHYNDPGYTPIDVIAEWPAHGNALYNEPADIAPFVDEDHNGVYEPLMGDYPLIKGTQVIFFVQNDRHPGGSGTIPMGLEIHCMAYVFGCAGNAALDHTVFVNYKFINKSTMTYQDAYAGLLTDTDLGYYLDDYLGCNVSKGLFYSYNGDNYDEPHAGYPGYGNSLPVQGVVLLAGPWQDADGDDNPVVADLNAAYSSNGIVYPALGKGFNDGIADNERLGMSRFMLDYGMGDSPYSLMSGPLYGPDSVAIDYMYFDNSDPLYHASHGVVTTDDWNEATAGNTPGDRRAVCGSGPFIIQPGEANEIDFAFTVSLDGPGPPLTALPTLYSRADAVRHYFNNNISPCGAFYSGVKDQADDDVALSVYPNPVDQVLNLKINHAAVGTAYTIQDIYGKVVMSGNLHTTGKMVDVSQLQEGVYLISADGKGAQKFVVQH